MDNENKFVPGEIVFTHKFWDIGLCLTVDPNGRPKKVITKDGQEYGGIQTVNFHSSGVIMAKEMWLAKCKGCISNLEVAEKLIPDAAKLYPEIDFEFEQSLLKKSKDREIEEIEKVLKKYFEIYGYKINEDQVLDLSKYLHSHGIKN